MTDAIATGLRSDVLVSRLKSAEAERARLLAMRELRVSEPRRVSAATIERRVKRMRHWLAQGGDLARSVLLEIFRDRIWPQPDGAGRYRWAVFSDGVGTALFDRPALEFPVQGADPAGVGSYGSGGRIWAVPGRPQSTRVKLRFEGQAAMCRAGLRGGRVTCVRADIACLARMSSHIAYKSSSNFLACSSRTRCISSMIGSRGIFFPPVISRRQTAQDSRFSPSAAVNCCPRGSAPREAAGVRERRRRKLQSFSNAPGFQVWEFAKDLFRRHAPRRAAGLSSCGARIALATAPEPSARRYSRP